MDEGIYAAFGEYTAFWINGFDISFFAGRNAELFEILKSIEGLESSIWTQVLKLIDWAKIFSPLVRALKGRPY